MSRGGAQAGASMPTWRTATVKSGKPAGRHHRSIAPFRCRLVIMVKAPVAGRVKTRLARAIGGAEALRFYRAASRIMAQRLGGQPFWETLLSVSPDADRASGAWPRHIGRIAQGRGDLGARMQRPMRTLPPGPVCVIGTDIPDVSVAHVRQAFRLLGHDDAVFGPAKDGGFWLVGMRRRRVIAPYRNVRWSSATTLEDVLSNLIGLRIGFTAALQDVDSAADLKRVEAAPGRLVVPSPGLRPGSLRRQPELDSCTSATVEGKKDREIALASRSLIA